MDFEKWRDTGVISVGSEFKALLDKGKEKCESISVNEFLHKIHKAKQKNEEIEVKEIFNIG